VTPLVIRAHPFVIVDLALREPVDDAWSLDVAVRESPTVVPVVDDAATCGPFVGAVVSVARDGGKIRMRIVGGKGRLGVRVATRYQGGPASLTQTLADLATEAGETAPPAADDAYGSAALDLPTWRVHGGSYRVESQRLATVLGLGWRVAPSGSVVVAAPAWGPATAPGKAIERGQHWVEYDGGDVAAYAGTTVDGVRVGCALSELGAEGGLRVTLFEQVDVPDAPSAGAVRAGILRAQSGDRLDVELDDGTLLVGLPLWLGVPGLTVELAAGARVLVLDLAGDPRQTCAMLAPAAEAPAVSVTWRGDDLRLGGTLTGTAPPGTFVRVGDIQILPVGAGATPTPMPVQLLAGPHSSVRG
jgi:hypothetical protein